MNQIFSKVTIYYRGDFGYSKVGVSEARCWFDKYAQHPNALFVEFKPKGKRKLKKIVESSKYSVLIINGWGHPDLNNFVEETIDNITARESVYPSYDKRYDQEFDEFISHYVEESKATVLVDFRKQD